MVERINLTDQQWQNDFERLNLRDSSYSSQNDQHFQHRLNGEKEQLQYSNYDSPVSLQYRDSISSNASSLLSRNSTISSNADGRCSTSTIGSPIPTHRLPQRTPTWRSDASSIETPTLDHFIDTLSPAEETITSPGQIYSNNSFAHSSIVDPSGLFVPAKTLPFVKKSQVTKNHYVVPTLAMAGHSQAEVMSLLFGHVDNQPFAAKEEHERTVSWTIDNNASLVTLSQYCCLGQENPVSRNYLSGLGQRLGITTILVIVSIEVIGTVYPLLNNLVKAMESEDISNKNETPSWWSRVVLVINQQHNVNEYATYSQRKSVLAEEIPRIQDMYRLSQPLSTLFVSTQLYSQIQNTSQRLNYKLCCQRILWQMMENHMLSGRWCNELSTLQNRLKNANASVLNILTEEDESDSSSDEGVFKTVIDYVDGKIKKAEKKKKKLGKDNAAPTLQRRSTRYQVQKLHCHDGDDGTSLPLPVRKYP